MDCNRDEALRAKDVAESKFKLKDVVGAKKFALKAQNLFPSLEGIDQMIAILDIHLAAETKMNGECDWYTILGVSASSDDETLKKSYRKLALQLHPDKNKFVGAEGAFKLISEAWSVLSDKTRKMAYDRSRNINGSQMHRNSSNGTANGFYEFSHTTKSSKRARKSNPAAVSSNPNTFWTSCSNCRMQYEYLRMYLNNNLLCPNCKKAFLATEIAVPANLVKSSGSLSTKHQNMNHSTSTFPGTGTVDFQQGGNFDFYSNCTQNFQWGGNTTVSGSMTGGATDYSSLQAANESQRRLEKLKRKQEKAQAAARRADFLCNATTNSCHSDYGNLDYSKNGLIFEHELPISRPGRPPKRTLSSNNIFYRGGIEANTFTISGISEVERATSLPADFSKTRVTSRQNSFSSEFSQVNARQLLIEKVKSAISEKLGEWNLQKQEKLKQQIGKDDCGENITDHVHQGPNMKSSNGPKEVRRSLSIDVPDPDFYDFDKDRLENTFEGDQVWATYDNEDGMPRFYAFVQKVLSLKPFKVRLSFLTSRSSSEFSSLNWTASGFAKTCGNFRVSRYETSDTINIFSHRVRWSKGPRGMFKILPGKGETWALYKNWSPDWDELTPDDVIHKYEMVEVLDDYDEERGVNVAPLLKVAGFKAVFHRHLDPKEMRTIPREEMFRFSHQVPSFLLTGAEAHSSLEGCRELDPAATPLELLKVVAERNDEVDTKNQ